MSHTPPDFQIPDFEEDTKRIVRAGELKGLARAAAFLVGSERERRGELKAMRNMLTVLLVVVPLLVTAGGAFFTWVARTLVEVQSDMRVLTVEVHDGNVHRQ